MIDRISPTANHRRASDSGRTRFTKFRRASLPETALAHTVARAHSPNDIAARFPPEKSLRDRVIGIRSYGEDPPSKRHLLGSRADDRRSGRRYLKDPASASIAAEAAAGSHGFSRFLQFPVEREVCRHRHNPPVATVIAARTTPHSRSRFPCRVIASTMATRLRLFSLVLRQAN